MSHHFSVKKFNYSGKKWRIVHTKSAMKVNRPVEMDHPNLGITRVMRPLLFPTKREALAYLAKYGDAMDLEYELINDKGAFFD